MLAELSALVRPDRRRRRPQRPQRRLGEAVDKEPIILGPAGCGTRRRTSRLLDEVSSFLPWPVVIAGERTAPGRNKATGGSDSTRFLGELAFAELADWLLRAAIFVAPARYEPFGLGAVEAGLAGCALVVGDIPAMHEVWGPAAVYVDPDDPDGLVSTLSGLCADQGRLVRLGVLARETSRPLHARVDGRRPMPASTQPAGERWRAEREGRPLLPLDRSRTGTTATPTSCGVSSPSCSSVGTRCASSSRRTAGAGPTSSPTTGLLPSKPCGRPFPGLTSTTYDLASLDVGSGDRRGRSRHRPRVERSTPRRPSSGERPGGRRLPAPLPRHPPPGASRGRRRSPVTSSSTTTASLPSGASSATSTSSTAGPSAPSCGTKRQTSAPSIRSPASARRGDLVWVGNWGDGERSEELREFLLEPVRELGLRGGRSTASAIRHEARAELAAAGIDYRGYLANHLGTGGLCRSRSHRARAPPALCRDAAGNPDDPALRGDGLRHPSRLGALGRHRRALSARGATISSRGPAPR